MEGNAYESRDKTLPILGYDQVLVEITILALFNLSGLTCSLIVFHEE